MDHHHPPSHPHSHSHHHHSFTTLLPWIRLVLGTLFSINVLQALFMYCVLVNVEAQRALIYLNQVKMMPFHEDMEPPSRFGYRSLSPHDMPLKLATRDGQELGETRLFL